MLRDHCEATIAQAGIWTLSAVTCLHSRAKARHVGKRGVVMRNDLLR